MGCRGKWKREGGSVSAGVTYGGLEGGGRGRCGVVRLCGPQYGFVRTPYPHI